MRYTPCWKQIGISRDRYMELLHFCRQYRDWKLEADSLLGIRAIKLDGQPHGSSVGDPVASAAQKRERLMRKVDIVDECARTVGGGAWHAAIVQNVCMGKSYMYIDQTIMPTSNKAEFFRHRREFFALLNERVGTK